MSEEKLFNIFVNKVNFDVSDYLVEELTEFQKQVVDDATFILKENIVGEIKSFGGSIKKNEDKFNEFMKKAEQELEDEKYKEIKKDLKEYLKKLPELIIKTCVAIIPVKELPWVDLIFRTIPCIVYDNKVQFFDHAIAYYGEIKCVIERTTIFGKMKGEEPLFAPFMGNLDLGSYKLDESQKGPKSQIYAYISAIINSFDSVTTTSQLAKYHEAYQRHGDLICDFLMKDEELINSMKKVTSALESDRIKSDITVYAIALPTSDNTSIVIVTEEGKGQARFTSCFEALLKLSAACCELPPSSGSTIAPSSQDIGELGDQKAGTIRTPGGQELKTWSAEELAQEAQKRMSTQPDMPVWSEEELTKFAEERGSTLPEGMEIWTEEELQELAQKRQGGGLNIPEWEPEQDLAECSNCGYSLRKGWSKCPICDTPVGSGSSEVAAEKPKEEAEEEPSEPSEQEIKDVPEDQGDNEL